MRRRKEVENNRYVWQRNEGDGETKKTNEGQTRQRRKAPWSINHFFLNRVCRFRCSDIMPFKISNRQKISTVDLSMYTYMLYYARPASAASEKNSELRSRRSVWGSSNSFTCMNIISAITIHVHIGYYEPDHRPIPALYRNLISYSAYGWTIH